jgi:hypothetical protein
MVVVLGERRELERETASTFVGETWSLTSSAEHKLQVFGNKERRNNSRTK